MKTRYRIVQRDPTTWMVESRSWRTWPFWWPVRGCFFNEQEALEYFQEMIDNQYPRVIREVEV